MNEEHPQQNELNNAEHPSKFSGAELKELTGLDDSVTEYVGLVLAGIFLGTVAIVPVGLVVAALWWLFAGFTMIAFSMLLKISAIIAYVLMIIFMIRSIWQTRKIMRRLKPLLQEVKRYNTVIDRLDTLEQLKNAGHQVDLKERATAMEALGMMRLDIVRALKTERILRDAPTGDFSDFSFDLTPFNALEAQEQSNEYAQLLSDTLQIGVQVRQEMKEFQPQKKDNLM